MEHWHGAQARRLDESPFARATSLYSLFSTATHFDYHHQGCVIHPSLGTNLDNYGFKRKKGGETFATIFPLTSFLYFFYLY